jgi:hypothetical protein
MAVRGGKAFDGIELRMEEGATFAGTLRAGDAPVPPGVRYQVIRREVTNGVPKLVSLSYAPVNADGRFTSRPIPPGDYYLVAWPAPSNGSESGPAGFAVTYFPGTPRIAEARLITLKAGERRDDLNFALVKTEMFTVAGAVHDAAGKPVHGLEVGLSFDTPPHWTRGTARTAADGTFAIANVQNGSYVLRGSRKTAAGTWESGELHFDVAGGDVAHLLVKLGGVR